MSLTISTPAEAKRQQEEDRYRAAALRNDRTEKRLNAQVEAALQSAASQATIAEAAKRQAQLADAAAKKADAKSLIALIVSVCAFLLELFLNRAEIIDFFKSISAG